jgi:nitronate monooxygenase
MNIMKTRITELLGIQFPIVEGGMQWVGRAQLAAAVSNAGALGMVAARTQPTPDDLRHEIERTRELTSKPFGVNLTLSLTASNVNYDGWIETAGNNPQPVIARLKEQGIKIIHKCTSVRHALSAERYGADVISIDGFEAAGHCGEDDVPALIMLPALGKVLKIPYIASGGIANGRSMAAALLLGAEGVNMGTRFMLTQESILHDDIKHALLAATERDTVLIKRTLKRTARFFNSPVSRQIIELERRPGGAGYDDLQHLLSGQRGLEGLESGDTGAGLICASQVIGLVDDLPTCADLVARMVIECREGLERTLARFDR